LVIRGGRGKDEFAIGSLVCGHDDDRSGEGFAVAPHSHHNLRLHIRHICSYDYGRHRSNNDGGVVVVVVVFVFFFFVFVLWEWRKWEHV
jgi:hypothetical protein